MAKRSSKSSGNIFRQLLYLLGILIVTMLMLFLERLDEAEDDPGPGPDQGNIEIPPNTPGSWYQVFFTQPINSSDPAQQVNAPAEIALANLINGAQRSIDAALFELNSPTVTDALVRALQRGVVLRLVLDDEHALEDPGSTVQQVIDAGAQIRSDERSAFMHNKYFIVDGIYVWTGSTNATRNGFYNNNNNALLLRSTRLVQNYQEDFEEMFTDGAFTFSDDTRDVPNRIFRIEDTQVETYFSPDDRSIVRNRIIELISGARSSIRIMAFSFTLEDVGQAVVQRLQQNVLVEGVFETTGSLRGVMPSLACAGANVRQDGNPNILHHKVIIIDERIVITGSFNFSNNAIDNNSENLVIIHNQGLAAAYLQEFRLRFAEGRIPPPEDYSC